MVGEQGAQCAVEEAPDGTAHAAEIAGALSRLYAPNRERYVRMKRGAVYMPKRGGAPEPLTDGVLMDHVMRKYSVAVFAEEEGSRFMCFDIDDGRRQTVRAVLASLSGMGIPSEQVYVSLSGGKGYHVELFFDRLIRTECLKALYDRVREACHLERHAVEFRPTSKQAIKLPLSTHHKTGRVCWFVDRET